jgi:hypothetical protein
VPHALPVLQMQSSGGHLTVAVVCAVVACSVNSVSVVLCLLTEGSRM